MKPIMADVANSLSRQFFFDSKNTEASPNTSTTTLVIFLTWPIELFRSLFSITIHSHKITKGWRLNLFVQLFFFFMVDNAQWQYLWK